MSECVCGVCVCVIEGHKKTRIVSRRTPSQILRKGSNKNLLVGIQPSQLADSVCVWCVLGLNVSSITECRNENK